ncbi:uncharacterized protein SAPINGB_P006349 [Magnusiomyces paraingens]|uniref:2-dehydropantoate 2-reductase n=1 Tax=Magnusiomyces paraingens TaxID=2606893 RepID=A0A5E8C9M2_9ASCO|nr:uncharacterized protein SAPINGB_P006349 [Saprochaete ingens]VVT58718.1 unnamed protein product [Saprochaete ingens]
MTTPRKQNILLVGSGGVGTVASVALEHSRKAAVTSVLRSDYDKVIAHGFEINSVDHGNLKGWRPSHVVKSVADAVTGLEQRWTENNNSEENNNNDDASVFDYIVVAIKALPDLVKTEDIIAPAMKPRQYKKGNNVKEEEEGSATQYPTVVLIQNGIGIEQPIIDAFPGAVVLSGVSMIGSHNFGGRIEQYEHDRLVVGYYDNAKTPAAQQEARARAFVDMYATTGVDCKYAEDVKQARWRKLVYNSTINTMCGLMQLDIGRCYLASIDTSVIVPAMHEILATAKAAGYEFPESLCETMLRADEGLYYKPSMQIDIEKGNPIELEVILGNPLRIARSLGVPTPILSVVYNLLKGVQFRLLEGRGLLVAPEKGPMWTDPRVEGKLAFPSEFPMEKK